MSNWSIRSAGDHIVGSFVCMASPCELLIDSPDEMLARHITEQAANEAFRIEQKYSRYRDDNIVSAINQAHGRSTKIDDETFHLLTFANTCFELSEGLFDITSGVLRRIWTFDGSNKIPHQSRINELLPLIGWENIQFDRKQITMPSGFEIDFGGMGKEYAVDCVAKICTKIAPSISVLVNFGGDIQVSKEKQNGQYWQVGIEMPIDDKIDKEIKSTVTATKTTYKSVMVRIAQGGLATSGDANRYLLHNGLRYSHVLNPKTGKPIVNGPRSVTVASEYCVQAGLMSTLALLQGNQAEQFLIQQEVNHWCYW